VLKLLRMELPGLEEKRSEAAAQRGCLLRISSCRDFGKDCAGVQDHRRASVPIGCSAQRGGLRDKVCLLELGADDYGTKPFIHDELLARGLRRAICVAGAGAKGWRVFWRGRQRTSVTKVLDVWRGPSGFHPYGRVMAEEKL